MKKIIGLVLILGLVAVGAFFAYRIFSGGMSIDIDQAKIQQQLDPRFPIEKNYLVSSVALSHPKVALKEGSDRIHFSVDVAASIVGQKKVTGTAEISGAVKYDANTGEFFLNDSKVENLAVSGLPDKHLDQIKTVVSMVGKEALDRFPIYKLSSTDRIQSMAKMFLKSVAVSHGKLRITMGIT